MNKLLILINCYFNYKDIERTVISILNNDIPVDIIFLENPSKYSNQIKNLATKYNIFKHFICNENIEFGTLSLFIKKYPDILNNYEYIAASEGDVELEKNSINECFSLLKKYNDCGNCSIDIRLDKKKYKHLPIEIWVPRS